MNKSRKKLNKFTTGFYKSSTLFPDLCVLFGINIGKMNDDDIM